MTGKKVESRKHFNNRWADLCDLCTDPLEHEIKMMELYKVRLRRTILGTQPFFPKRFLIEFGSRLWRGDFRYTTRFSKTISRFGSHLRRSDFRYTTMAWNSKLCITQNLENRKNNTKWACRLLMSIVSLQSQYGNFVFRRLYISPHAVT